MRIRNSLFAALASVLALSCSGNSGTDTTAVISIDSDRAVAVPAKGGSVSVLYSIQGASWSGLTAETDASWIEVVSVTDGIVKLNIPENATGSSRMGRLFLSCSGARDQSVVISQSAEKGEILPRGHFDIKVSDIVCDGAGVVITPDDYSVSYSWGVISRKEYLAMGKEKYIRSRIEMMEGLAALYGRPFSELLQTGPLSSAASNLFDGLDYYVVAFELDERKTIPSEISIVSFRSAKARQSSMTLSLSVIGSQMLVNPSTASTYVCDCTLKSTFDSYDDPMDIAREYVSTLRTYGYLQQYVFTGQHNEDLSASLTDGLIPGMQYVCYAVGYTMDASAGPGFTTEMFTKEFTYASK